MSLDLDTTVKLAIYTTIATVGVWPSSRCSVGQAEAVGIIAVREGGPIRAFMVPMLRPDNEEVNR